ncbi:MAG: NAD-dependent dihydropyrimidine dehydrogenase subunit PreA [Prevotella ruminicola]|jgi:dihydropyrimidine dehydrogenase (NAD+) subunit PreA|uniref:dihydrouracil dehydrogenase (NAD(+)) n=1 Tax=Xylanibacter ruminicola TaxID=839 RepID=A0A9D5P233_XYLRU|nr:NAD-dependent dihydropyrimidine dehydrogenase subunit PreA [Xylanibacter ruminicola]
MMHKYEEVVRCLLCEDAPCTKACGKGDVARAIRAIRFDNEKNAWRWVAGCTDDDLLRAEQACIHYDRPIRIRELLTDCTSAKEQTVDATQQSLGITFCGIDCENPFFLASSAVCTNYDMVARAFEAGWAGVFYKTICKQDIREVSPRFDAVKKGTTFAGFRNMEQLSENPYQVDFNILRRLKQNYPTKVVIASIMGQFEEEWIELAKLAEEAGCDAIELNFSCPQMRLAGMGSDIGQDPELVNFYTSYVKRSVKIPVIPKMTPNITQMTRPAMGAYFAGADAISAINTIKSVTMSKEAEVSGKQTLSGYSGQAVKPIALRFILEMSMDPVINGTHGRAIELSGIGGIETWRDAVDFIQLGCRNVQVCTAVMQYGYRIIDDLVSGLQTYLTERGFEKLDDLVGEQLPNFVRPSDLDRDTMVYPKVDHERCIGCGRCYISCMDGGHQAIAFEERQPRIIGTKCVGCHLCRLVCSTGAIGLTKRIPKKR